MSDAKEDKVDDRTGLQEEGAEPRPSLLRSTSIKPILCIPPLIPAGIQEFRGIPGIPEDSGWNGQESSWNRQRILLFRLYFALLFQTYVLEQGNRPK